MLKFSALLAFIILGFMVWCLVEAISTDGRRIRNLPKVAWVLLILFLPLVGGIAWLLGGRPSAVVATAGTPDPDRATRADSRNPAEEAADFSTRIRERAEEQRRRYEQQKKKDADKQKPEADQPEAGTEQP